MPDLPNWQEFGLTTGQDKPSKEPAQEYDRRYGVYDGKASEGGKPTESASKLPAEPMPFNITGR